MGLHKCSNPEGGQEPTGAILGDPQVIPLEFRPLPAERNFYRRYTRALNVYPSVAELREFLFSEFSHLRQVPQGWTRTEVAINIFLLACSLTEAADDYLLGKRYGFQKVVNKFAALEYAISALNGVLSRSTRIRERRLRRLHLWREKWDAAVVQFVVALLKYQASEQDELTQVTAALATLLEVRLPAKLLAHRRRIPAAFHSQSLTHHDVLALVRKFVALHPDRSRKILLVGLRTAGSHFAPLALASLRSEGFEQVDCVTIRPNKGVSSWEAAKLTRGAKEGALAVLLDDPMNTGSAIAQSVDFLIQAGFTTGKIWALMPNHPSRRGWQWPNKPEFAAAREIGLLLLEGDEWHKSKLMEPEAMLPRLQEYFLARGYRSVSLGSSQRLEEASEELRSRSIFKGHIQLKRVYELHLEDPAGKSETRYVLAKSAGWGWLSYHSFLTALQLADFLPPVLGLRDGFIFSEWLLYEKAGLTERQAREQEINRLATYVAARVRTLRLRKDPLPELFEVYDTIGLGLLAKSFGNVFHHPIAASLRQGRLREKLKRITNPVPTFVDGKMEPSEWVRTPVGLLKTDFAHHGFGKPDVNATDPAYDLADAILNWDLSVEEENGLLSTYVAASGDTSIHQRLFLYKILAGVAASDFAQQKLVSRRCTPHHPEANQRFIAARNFLSIQAARFCGSRCQQPRESRWQDRLVVSDIDGVLDSWSFGFCCTSAAGIEAVSLLHAHDYAIAVDTARSLREVQEYCKAYGFAGGVAEYGSVIWDSIARQKKVLVDTETLAELEKVRFALQQIPGTFLNDSYEYSLRAYRFEEGWPVALPEPIILGVFQNLGVQRLRFRQTQSDTAILGKDIDKGTGLRGLLQWVGVTEAQTIALGDSEEDLPLFRAAGRCFAPAQIHCREAALHAGCKISDRAYQAGLLQIVRTLIHPNGRRCQRCRGVQGSSQSERNFFLELLEMADRTGRGELLKALFDLKSLQAFAK
jgi:hydroxymethylpyrimidine pyrophosphatase-like HAD family hydrolase